jgi:cytochrome c
MRKALSFVLLVGFLLTGRMAFADVTQLTTLMQRNNCLACHMIDKRKYGPNMKEVAAKYAGNTAAVDLLASKIKAGGSGVWGADMMPPQPHVTDENARLMAQLILSLDTK